MTTELPPPSPGPAPDPEHVDLEQVDPEQVTLEPAPRAQDLAAPTPPRRRALVALIVVTILAALAAQLAPLVALLAAGSIVPVRPDFTGGRAEKPWTAGGAIVHAGGFLSSSSSACSTAGLGTYQGRWAFLTAAHCVGNDTGAEVHTVDGQPLGTSVWVSVEHDLAIVDITNQDAVSPDDARIWTGNWTTTTSRPVTGHLDTAPGAGTGGMWIAGAEIGTVGGPHVRVLGTVPVPEAADLTHVGTQRRDPMRPILAARGQSGAGVYQVIRGRWYLWGVASAVKSKVAHQTCDTVDGTSSGCSRRVLVAPITPALDAGFAVATTPDEPADASPKQ